MNTDNISKGYAYTSTMTNVRTAVYGTEQQNVSLYSSCANQQEKTKENTTVSAGIDLSFSKEGKTLQKIVRETGVWKEITQQEQEQINVEEEKVDVKDDQENQAEALIKSLEEKLQRLQEKKKIKKEAPTFIVSACHMFLLILKYSCGKSTGVLVIFFITFFLS